MVPLELLKQSLISLSVRNRNFKQNTRRRFWSQLFPRPVPLSDHRFGYVPDWRIQYVEVSAGDCTWVPCLLNTAPTCVESSLAIVHIGFCTLNEVMMWYTKTSFKETGNLEIVSHQFKNDILSCFVNRVNSVLFLWTGNILGMTSTCTIIFFLSL